MKAIRSSFIAAAVVLAIVSLNAAEIKVDLGKEQLGKTPKAFQPIVGAWIVAKDGDDPVIMVDGRPWVSRQDNPTKLLLESARNLFCAHHEGDRRFREANPKSTAGRAIEKRIK